VYKKDQAIMREKLTGENMKALETFYIQTGQDEQLQIVREFIADPPPVLTDPAAERARRLKIMRSGGAW
jgi:hypothetical protein